MAVVYLLANLHSNSKLEEQTAFTQFGIIRILLNHKCFLQLETVGYCNLMQYAICNIATFLS